MHCLEYSLFTLTAAVQKGEITNAKLASFLATLTGGSSFYSPEGREPYAVVKASEEIGELFDHLLHSTAET